MLLYFFGFLRLFSFHCVFLMCCFMSTGDMVKKTAEVIIIPRRVTEDQLSVALYKHSKTSNTSKSL